MQDLSVELKVFARKFYRAIGTPLAMKLLQALERGDWDTIATCKVDPREYTNSQEYFLDASASAFLRKCIDLPTSHDREAAAYATWREGEDACFRTNERLNPYLEGCTHPDWNEEIALHIGAIQKRVAAILGRCPAMDHLRPRHGPGATFSDKASAATVADKMVSAASITHGAYWFLLDWVGTVWGREALALHANPFPVRGNRFSTAPKDATKHRPIGLEASINVFYQLGVELEIRSRLRTEGIDLDKGQDIHRQAACEASISGRRATMDLTNASGTVATNAVKLCTPADWYHLLDQLRSPFTRMGGDKDGRWHKLEQFSSMGNGYTFALETLLFYVITDYAASVVCGDDREKTLVFGDDIICDSRAVEAVTSLLGWFGFSLNKAKSFVGGVFRESCGGDFWAGRPVRPYYLKGAPSEPQHLIAMANGIRRLGEDLFGGLGPLASLWFSIQDHIPGRIRQCRGPSRLGDIVIHDHEQTWTLRGSHYVLGYAPMYHREVDLHDYPKGVVHACGLYGETVSKGFILPRDSVTGYGLKKVPLNACKWLPEPFIRRGPPVTSTTQPAERLVPGERPYWLIRDGVRIGLAME